MAATLTAAMSSLSLKPAKISNVSQRQVLSHGSVSLSSSRSGFSGFEKSLSVNFSTASPISRKVVGCRAAASTDVAVEAESSELSKKKEARAFLKGIRMSDTKVRRVVNQIRGRSYEEALMILEFMPYRACEPVLKVVTSAAANASNILGYSKADLYVSSACVNQGPTMKRFHAGPKGRGMRILKRTCYVEVIMKSRADE